VIKAGNEPVGVVQGTETGVVRKKKGQYQGANIGARLMRDGFRRKYRGYSRGESTKRLNYPIGKNALLQVLRRETDRS